MTDTCFSYSRVPHLLWPSHRANCGPLTARTACTCLWQHPAAAGLAPSPPPRSHRPPICAPSLTSQLCRLGRLCQLLRKQLCSPRLPRFRPQLRRLFLVLEPAFLLQLSPEPAFLPLLFRALLRCLQHAPQPLRLNEPCFRIGRSEHWPRVLHVFLCPLVIFPLGITCQPQSGQRKAGPCGLPWQSSRPALCGDSKGSSPSSSRSHTYLGQNFLTELAPCPAPGSLPSALFSPPSSSPSSEMGENGLGQSASAASLSPPPPATILLPNPHKSKLSPATS